MYSHAHNNQNAEYSFSARKVQSVDHEKDLGVIISNDLKFSKQCIKAEKTAQKMV